VGLAVPPTVRPRAECWNPAKALPELTSAARFQPAQDSN
jgi:hypothetical protein